MKTYKMMCVLVSAAVALYACTEEAEILPIPEEPESLAKTGPATIDETEVTLEGTYVYDGSENVSAGFRYAKTQTELAAAEIIPAEMTGEGSFYLVIPNVENGDWWYQSVVEIGGEKYNGKTGFFKVDFSLTPSLTTRIAEITENAYILKGTYVFESRKIQIVPGFFYAATEDELETASFVTADVNGKDFSYEVPLSFGEKCVYQAAALVNGEYYRGAVRSAGLTNLSINGPANCFVIKDPGVYYFSPVKADGTAVDGDVADWMWCTGTETILENISFNDGRIMFTSDGSEGSEMIALLKDGVIQWSWHIWVSSEVRDQEFNGITMMDRNLGALGDDAATPDAIGLMYQWGCKNPFIGTNVMDKTIPTSTTESLAFSLEPADRVWTAPYIYNAAVVPDGFRLQQVKCTEDLVAHNPMVFYGNWNSGNWAASNATIQDYWGAVSHGTTLQNPCPAGYRVPVHSEMASYINGLINAGEFGYANYNKTWGRKGTYNGDTYNFPATGWRVWHGALIRPGNVIAMHTATAGPVECGTSIYWDFNLGPGSDWMCQAFPVRCIKIQ